MFFFNEQHLQNIYWSKHFHYVYNNNKIVLKKTLNVYKITYIGKL